MTSHTSDFVGNSRFTVRRRLGSGGMGVVYEVVDRSTNTPAALKLLKNLDAGGLLRFKREFRMLQGLDHPNLVGLGELFEEHGQWFFTMELVDGVDFLSYVRPKRCDGDDFGSDHSTSLDSTVPMSHEEQRPIRYQEQRLRSAMAQLSLAISALHNTGTIHRDIKPSNVIVTSDGRAVLLDFGLATYTEWGLQSTTTQVVGTAAYMAPEQAASGAIGPEADWYSMGVMLFQSLTGTLPFIGSDIEILMDKQKHEPKPAHALAPLVPPDLDELCAELLRFEPSARPLERDILKRLGAQVVSMPAAVGSTSRHSEVSQFFGRESELAQLQEALGKMRRGQGCTVVVHGKSGLGKTALVDHFARGAVAADRDTVLLTGRCYARESIPFKAFDGVIDSLATYMVKLPDAEAAMLLPKHASLLSRMFPVLSRVSVIAEAPQPLRPIKDHLELRRRGFHALREMLDRITERHRLIVVIDDLQWADSDSLLLLGELLHPPDPPPLLLLSTSRSLEMLVGNEDAHEENPVIPGDVAYVEVGPLADETAQRLAETLLARYGSPSSATPEEIAREAGGHPLYIDELVRHASLARTEGCDAVKLDNAIWARASTLPANACKLLEVSAVAGAPLSLNVFRVATRMDAAELNKAASVLRVANLIRSGGTRGESTIEPYHDRVREAVLTQLSDDQRREHHTRLAFALKGLSGRPELLLRHLEAAGENKRASAYAKEAARRASESLAFDQAVEFYKTCIRTGSFQEEELRALRVKLSTALLNAGRGAESAREALAAAEGADPTTRLECMTLAAGQLLICGHVEPGLAVLRELIAEVGVRMPATPRRALLSVVWHRLKLRVRGLHWQQKHLKEIAASELTRVDIFNAAGQGLSMVDNVQGADFQARGLLLALRTGELQRVARALGTEAVYNSSQGGRGHARALILAEQVQQLARKNGDPYLRAWSHALNGILSYFGGEFRVGAEALERAVACFHEETNGMTFELNNARMFRIFALRHMGAYGEMSRLYTQYLRDAGQRGDVYVETTLRFYGNSVWLARDDAEGGHVSLSRARWQPPEGRFHLQHWYELEARAEAALYEQKVDEVSDDMARRFAGMESSMLSRIQLVRCLAHSVKARLALARVETATPAAVSKVVSRAVRLLSKEDIGYAQVFAEMLRAGLAIRMDTLDEAVPHLDRVIERATALGMRFYAAAAQRRKGEILNGDEGGECVRDADQWFEAQGVRAPDRFVRIIAPVDING